MQKRKNLTLSNENKVYSYLQIDEDYEKWLSEFVGTSNNEKEKHSSSPVVNNPYYQPIQGA